MIVSSRVKDQCVIVAMFMLRTEQINMNHHQLSLSIYCRSLV